MANFPLGSLFAFSEYMPMPLVIPADVARDLVKLPKVDARRLVEALQTVAADLSVRQPFVTEMVGQPGTWRLRKGDWRAVYRVVEGDVVVDRVAHRREVYR